MKIAALQTGVELAYDERGSGYPVLMLAPTGFDHTIFIRGEQVAALESRFRPVLVDLRGTGQSSKPSYAYEACDLADDVAGLMSHLGLSRAHFIGCSLGSLVCQQLAVRHPTLVSALVLTNTWSRTDEYLRRKFEIWHYLYSKAALDFAGRVALWWQLSEGFVNEHSQDLDQLARSVFASPGAPPRETYLRQLRISTDHDAAGLLPQIDASTLVVGGAEDRVVPPRYAREVAELIRGCEYLELTGPGSSHLLALERSGELNEAAVRFLDGVTEPEVQI